MESDLLKRGCEAAGLLWDEDDKEWCGESVDGYSGAFLYAHDDPALPAYVASLLVAKAEPVDDGWAYMQAIKAATSKPTCFATPEQIIRAALAVLGATPAD